MITIPRKPEDSITAIAMSEKELEIIKGMLESNDLLYINRENVFVIEKNESILQNLQSSNVLAFPSDNYSYYMKKVAQKAPKLAAIKEDYAWINGQVDFVIRYSDYFEIFTVSKGKIISKKKVSDAHNVVLSNNGNLFAFYYAKIVVLFANEKLNCIYQMIEDENIENVSFSLDDQYVILTTASKLIIYDVWRGSKLHTFTKQNFRFTLNSVQLFKDKTFYYMNENRFEDYSADALVFTNDKNSLRVIYKDDKLSSSIIIEKDSHDVISKSYNNVNSFDCQVLNQKVVCLITKKISDQQSSFVEVFHEKRIQFLKCEEVVQQFYTDGKSLVLIDVNNNIYFYQISKQGIMKKHFIKISSSVVVSIYKEIIVIYVRDLNKLIFYDNFVQRTSASVNSCTSMKWSQDGLYLAVFSESPSSSELYIFDTNGKEVFSTSKFLNLTYFSWRNHQIPDLPTEQMILKENRELIEKMISQPNENDLDHKEAVQKWRSYLLSIIEKQK